MFKFKRSKFLLSAVFSLLGLGSPQSAHGQNTVVNLQTVYANFAGNTCTGTPQTFFPKNLGQVSHQVSVVSNATSMSVEVDGFDGFSTYRMSNPAVSIPATGGNTNYVAIGSGTYAQIIISVTCSIGSVYSITYAGAQTGFQSVNIGPSGGSTQTIGGGVASQVQGIVTQQQSAGTVDPIILGGLQLPINANFLTAGIDNFNTGQVGVPAGSAGTFTVGTVPTPTKSGEFAVAFEANISDAGTGTSIVSPWTCAPLLPGNCGSGSPQMSMAYLANVSAGQVYQRTFSNSTPNGQDLVALVLFSSSATTIRQDNIASGLAVVSYSGNTLANSTKIAALRCATTTPCTVSGVTDTQGGTWALVEELLNNGSQASGIWVYASTTLSTAAADTITFTLSSGTAAGTMAAELTGTTTSTLTTPSISLGANPIGTLLVTEDAQFPNQFVCNVTLSTATTTQCQAPPTTINNVPVRAYVTDIQVNTTTLGAGSTLQLKTGTGTNCGTGTANLSAITYSGAAVALQNMLDFRTPLFAPLQSAVCVTQVGATPSTSVVEVHGYFAP